MMIMRIVTPFFTQNMAALERFLSASWGTVVEAIATVGTENLLGL
jgi:hypothetical protein